MDATELLNKLLENVGTEDKTTVKNMSVATAPEEN